MGYDAIKGQHVSWLFAAQSRDNGDTCWQNAVNEDGDVFHLRMDVPTEIGGDTNSWCESVFMLV